MSFVNKHPLTARNITLDEDLVNQFDALFQDGLYSVKSLEAGNKIFLSEADLEDILYYRKMYLYLEELGLMDAKAYNKARNDFFAAVKTISQYGNPASVSSFFPQSSASDIRVKIRQIFIDQVINADDKVEFKQIGEQIATIITSYKKNNINYQNRPFLEREKKNRKILVDIYESENI